MSLINFLPFGSRVSKNFVYRPALILKQYNDNYYRLIYMKSVRMPGFEEVKKRKKNKIENINDDNIDYSTISRSKRKIREYILCNEWNYFVTLTVNGRKHNRYDVNEITKHLRKCLHRLRKKSYFYDCKFNFLFVIEKHKDGAYHLHGVINIPENFLYENKNGHLSCKQFDDLGFQSFEEIEKDKEGTAHYITKYISKECIRFPGKSLYICSRGLKLAESETFYNFSDLSILLDNDFFKFMNEYCMLRDFKLNELSKEELQELYFLLNSKGNSKI